MPSPPLLRTPPGVEPRTAVFPQPIASDIARAVAAFLNTSGGRVLIGVSEDGHVQGLKDNSLSRSLEGEVHRLIKPRPRFSLMTRRVGNNEILLIDVPPGTDQPYVFSDRIFVWRSGSLHQASPDEISDIIVGKVDTASRWERQPVLQARLEDLERDQIWKTFEMSEERRIATSGQSRPHSNRAAAEFLTSLQLMSGGKVLNSAIVLFGKAPGTFLPQTKLRCGVFASEDRSRILDNKIFDGSLFSNFQRATSLLDFQLPLGSTFEGHTRHDSAAIPPFVLREALMNALVHCDYSQADSNVTIAMHPRHLEIWNPGRLPSGISPSNLPHVRVSRPPNPDIANVAFLRGLVEQWGSGTGRMLNECQAAGLPDPVWEEVGGGVRVTILLTRQRRAIDEQSLSPRVRRFLLDTFPGQEIQFDDYLAKWADDMSSRTGRRDLQELVDLGFLREVGQRPLVYVRTDKILVR
jgi:ATP-dependent DNA helicase RecG